MSCMVEAYGPSAERALARDHALDQLSDEHLLEPERGLVILDGVGAGGADVGRQRGVEIELIELIA